MNEKLIVKALLEQCQDRAKSYENGSNDGMIASMVWDEKNYYIRGPHNIDHLTKRISKVTKISQTRVKKVLLQLGSINRKGAYYISEDIVGADGRLSKLVVKLKTKLQNGRTATIRINEPLKPGSEISVSGKVKSDGKSIYLEPIDIRRYGNRIDIVKVNDYIRSLVGSGSLVVVKTKVGDATHPTIGFGEVIGTPIGDELDPAVGIASVLADGGYSETFSEDVEAESNNLPLTVTKEEIDQMKKTYKTFEDWRDVRFTTIDPRSCKDMDDSVYCRVLPNGDFELKVAIALVAHYVKKGSATCNEAIRRGNSVYVGDKVCPMLTKELSNNICSINPGQDRLALGGRFIISKNGEVVSSEFLPVVMRSRHKMAYDTVDSIFYGKDDELKEKYRYSIKHFDALREADNIMRSKSKNKGFLQLRDNEATFKFSEDRTQVNRVFNDNGTTAHKIVENAMLIYNEEFAKLCAERNIPIIYRVEPGISADGEEKIYHMLNTLNLPLIFDENMDIRTTINGAIDAAISKDKANKDKILAGNSSNIPRDLVDMYPLTNAVSYGLIRSISRAEYRASNIGHFATAKAVYTHMTSPIRRACDLVNQQQFLSFLSDGKCEYDIDELSRIATHISECEYNADVVERKGDDVISSIYVANNLIGSQLLAVVKSVDQDGINMMYGPFGNIRISIGGMRDRFVFNRDKHMIYDRKSGKKIRFGKTLTIKITSVDRQRGIINGEIVTELVNNKEFDNTNKSEIYNNNLD